MLETIERDTFFAHDREGNYVEWLSREEYERHHDGNEAPGLLPLIDIAGWKGDPPARRSLWGSWLPLHQTTMLTGPGGVGKSLFEQCLCTAIALGKPFLGMETEQRNTLYVTCEDDADELWRRQDAINAAFEVDRADIIGKLHLCALTGEDETALAVEGEHGTLDATERWQQVEQTCKAHQIGLYAFDNATDAMAGDHSNLHHVAAFVNMLTGLAIKRDGVAMIIHHPNKAGDDWLGSVAWHNKVRSRLIIGRGEDDVDPDARTIENPKANYGPSGGRVDFRWHQGAFVRSEDLPGDYAEQLAQSIRVQSENEIFLACLRARMAQPGREVGPNLGSNYAPARFAEMTEAKGLPKGKLARAMERLLYVGRIETQQVKRKGSDKKTIIAEVDPNAS
ncbi:AAA family ATPase [Qipengyuania spongiae]|uniref:AAA family ATPase n=1 Tax=Qipengyuania spongiae TaxID=2909673 RepID=A0ABY5T1N6_9SPHN|nr:AAA family ATPase [Qipengyuania spongiae]UVI39241.1 AAA family ATPase [Qipengyuania spongiae]